MNTKHIPYFHSKWWTSAISSSSINQKVPLATDIVRTIFENYTTFRSRLRNMNTHIFLSVLTVHIVIFVFFSLYLLVSQSAPYCSLFSHAHKIKAYYSQQWKFRHVIINFWRPVYIPECEISNVIFLRIIYPSYVNSWNLKKKHALRKSCIAFHSFESTPKHPERLSSQDTPLVGN